MTIDEAIKHLEMYRHDHHSYPTDIMGKAEQLGIEALRQIKQIRAYAKELYLPLLPGETKE
ncbi:hypothetical protein ES708_05535 [subsurface metagenome]